MPTEQLNCGDCGAPMKLRHSPKYGPFFGCIRYPECDGTHGCHADGKPLGIPANKATKEARMRAHAMFDQLWLNRGWSRQGAYAWMREAMGMTKGEAHIGRFDIEQCERLILLCADVVEKPCPEEFARPNKRFKRTCPECQKEFKDRKAMRQHRLDKHNVH